MLLRRVWKVSGVVAVLAAVACSDPGSSEDSPVMDAGVETSGVDTGVEEDVAEGCGGPLCDATWEPLPAPAHHRIQAELVKMSDGSVLLIGGRDANFTHFTVVERLDPTTRQWAEVAPMPVAMEDIDAVALDNNRVLVTGYFARNALLYDANADTWTEFDDRAWGMRSTLVAAIGPSRVLVFDNSFMLDWGIFDLEAEEWVTEGAVDGFTDTTPVNFREVIALQDGSFLVYEESSFGVVKMTRYEATMERFDATFIASESETLPGFRESVLVWVESLGRWLVFCGQKVDEVASVASFGLEAFRFEEHAALVSDEWIAWRSATDLGDGVILLTPDFWSPYPDALPVYDAVQDEWSQIEAPLDEASYAPVVFDDGSLLFMLTRQSTFEVWLLKPHG